MDMTLVLQTIVLLLVAGAGPAVVLTRDPYKQTIGLGFFGLCLAILFVTFQAPDVALSQLVIGAVTLPLMLLLALVRIQRDRK